MAPSQTKQSKFDIDAEPVYPSACLDGKDVIKAVAK
jgi:hypothetical protein